jgi:uncharacterized protein (TIGR00730 family)
MGNLEMPEKVMKTICVQCGSSIGAKSCYAEAASHLGAFLAGQGLAIVYGGSNVGIMGVMARAALDKGGRVIGVTPEHIKQRVEMLEVTEQIMVSSMHERKQKMFDLSDGFIAMPGGYGTLEEFFEVVTWSQLELHSKPCGLLNVNGYFNNLLGFLDESTREGFIKPLHRNLICVDADPAGLVAKIQSFHWEKQGKW